MEENNNLLTNVENPIKPKKKIKQFLGDRILVIIGIGMILGFFWFVGHNIYSWFIALSHQSQYFLLGGITIYITFFSLLFSEVELPKGYFFDILKENPFISTFLIFTIFPIFIVLVNLTMLIFEMWFYLLVVIMIVVLFQVVVSKAKLNKKILIAILIIIVFYFLYGAKDILSFKFDVIFDDDLFLLSKYFNTNN